MTDTSRVTAVVGAVIVRDGRVLAAHRRTPVGWEFPGGKIEPGETAARAVVRECREELGIDVVAVRELGTARDGAIALTLWRVDLLHGEPVAGTDHDRLAWVSAAELDTLDWLVADRALLDTVFG